MHWTLPLTSSYSKTFVFERQREYDKSPFLTIYGLESVFKNLRICGRKRRLRVDGRCKQRKKLSVFENIRIRVVGAIVTKGSILLQRLFSHQSKVLVVLLFFTMLHLSFSVPLDDFYPYGVSKGDTALPANDDSSSGSIPISISFPYFNQSHNSLFVSKNAFI